MRILFADDHDLLRDTLKAYLEADEGITVDLAPTVADALDLIARDGPYDVVLLDFQIPGMDGLLGLRQIVAAQQGKPVIMLTGVATAGTATAALRFGAATVLSKTLSIDKLKNVVVSMTSGDFAPAYTTDTELAGSPQAPTLTPREEQVLRGICRGLANKQIARELNLQETTIKMYVKTIYMKFNVNSRTQAIIAARNLNLF